MTTEQIVETTKIKWDEANTAVLAAAAADGEVSYSRVEELAEELGTSARAVSSKLRSLGFEVAKKAVAASVFSEAEGEALAKFVSTNEGKFTYAEIAENFLAGKFTAKQIQGKVLALELTKSVKATAKVEYVSTYTDAEVATIVAGVKAGKFIEEIAESVGRDVKSLRGKCLSLLQKEVIASIPKSSKPAAVKVDAFEGLNIAALSVAEIAVATEKTERGVKAMLPRRGLTAKDYAPKTKVEVAA